MAGLGSVTLSLGANIKQFRTKMQEAEKTFKRFGQKMQNVGGTMSRTVTAPLMLLGGGAIKAASDFEETESKFDAVFQHLSDGAKDWAAETASAFNRSKGDVMGYMSALQDTFVPMGFAREDAAEFSKTLTSLAIDMASFNNTSDEEALRSLQSAIVGNHKTMQKYGVVINQTTLGNELMNMGLKDGVKNATEAQKAQARLNIILKGTKDAQGDAIRTSGSFANSMRGLKGSIVDLGVELGQMLMPHVMKIVEKVKLVVSAFRNLDEKTKMTVLKIAGLAAAVGPLLLGFGKVMVIIPQIARAMAMLTGPIGLIVGALAMAAVLIVKNWEKIKNYFTSGDGAEMFTMIKDIVIKSMSLIGEIVRVTVQFIADIWARIGPFIVRIAKSVFQAVGSVIKTVLNFILDILGFFQRVFAGGWEGLFNGVKTFFVKIWRSIVRFLLSGLIKVMKGMKKLLEAFGAKKLANKVDSTTSSLENYSDGLKNVANGSVSTGKEIKKINKDLDKQKDVTGEIVDNTLDLDDVTKNYNDTLKKNSQIDGVGDNDEAEKVFDLKKSMEEYAASFDNIDKKAEVFGKMNEDFDANAEKASLIKSQINTLIDNGIDPASQEIQNLTEEFKRLNKEGGKTGENLAAGLQKFANIAGQIMGDVGAIFSQYFEMKMQGLENEKAAEEQFLSDEHQRQIDAIENSTMNQAQKDRELATLQEQHDTNMQDINEKFGKKMAEQKAKQARADKAMAIANTIINTAAGVGAALAKGGLGIGMAIAIGAMGAAQVALIAGTPIPAMAQGGIVTGPTTALIGEAGAEAVIPLDKLGSMMGDMQTVNVVGKISGDDIILVSDRARQNRTRVRGINS